MIGQSVAHYEITGKLGAGGMAEVYRVTDTKLGREVVVKMLPSDVTRMPDTWVVFSGSPIARLPQSSQYCLVELVSVQKESAWAS